MEMSAWMESCRNRALVRDSIQMDAADHVADPWGSGMEALATLTTAAFWLGVEVDPDIATPSPCWSEVGGEWIHSVEYDRAWELGVAIQEGQASIEDLEFGIRFVNRYLNIAEKNGHRY